MNIIKYIVIIIIITFVNLNLLNTLIDRELVYSKRFPEGDNATRTQLRIPKSNLGICIPLALETNGSVFSARKLLPKFKYPIKRFATIFAKRVAKSAAPPANQTCECSGHNTGVSYMSCSPSTDAVEDRSPLPIP